MEDVIGFVFIVLYLLSYLRGFLPKRSRRNEPAQPVSPRSQEPSAEASSVGGMLEEIRRQVAEAAREQEVAGEHRRTVGEHRPTLSEHRPTASELEPHFSDHLQTPSELLVTQTEHMEVESEHRVSLTEHTKGDAKLPPIPLQGPAKAGRSSSRFARELTRDLRGRAKLARAVVLQEILSPPVSLRQGGERPV